MTRRKIVPGQLKAHSLTNQAVVRGELPQVKSLLCVDCGAPATEYDHRDYARPLDVQPVCHPCNLERGPALHADTEPAYVAGRSIGYILSAEGIARVRFKYLDFGLYEDTDAASERRAVFDSAPAENDGQIAERA